MYEYFFLVPKYVSFHKFKSLKLSEVIRAEAETLFSVLLKMQIHLLMLLLFLMKFSNLVLIKVETNPNIMKLIPAQTGNGTNTNHTIILSVDS